MAAVMFQGPPFLKVGSSLGPHFIILNPPLPISVSEFHSDMSDEAMHSDASETSDMSEVSKISTISVRSTQSEKPRRKLRFQSPLPP